MAEAKIASYNPDKKADDSEWEGEQIGWYTLVTRYADVSDMFLLWGGIIGSVCFGAALPGFCYYFGTMIDGVAEVSVDATNGGGSDGGMMDLASQSYMMIYIGIGAFFVSWF